MTDTSSQTPPARSTAARIISVAAGTITGAIAIALIVAGGVLLWGNGKKDADGFLSTGSDRFATSTYALASDNLDVDLDGAGSVVDRDRYGKIRLRAFSHEGKPVFVGIARTADVSRYLDDIAHATVSDVTYSPFRATYRTQTGDRRPQLPGEQDFWAASASGAGGRTVTWDVTDGSWSVVVMNADGSRGVDAGVSAGASVPFLSAAGWASFGGGLLLLGVSAGFMILGLRPPHQRRDVRDTTELASAAA